MATPLVAYDDFSYSLGDAIDWKHISIYKTCLRAKFSYSLGDAIDWKLYKLMSNTTNNSFLLLARGRDRLETH